MADVRRSNPNAFKELERKLNELDGYEAKIGWFEESVYPDGTPVAQVAALNEYGPHKRPFMRPAMTKSQQAWKEAAGLLAKQMLSPKNPLSGQDAMDLLAQRVQADVLKQIRSVNTPPLSPVTLAVRKMRQDGEKITGATVRKVAAHIAAGDKVAYSTNTKPLDDTNRMISTLSHKVEST